MTDKWKAAAFIALAILTLIAACFFGALFPGARAFLVVAGVAGYILAGRAALALLCVDEMVLESARRSPRHPRAFSSEARASRGASAVAAGLVLGALNSVALGQAANSAEGFRSISEGSRDPQLSGKSATRIVAFRHRNGQDNA